MNDNHAFSEGGVSQPKVCFGKAGFFHVEKISVELK